MSLDLVLKPLKSNILFSVFKFSGFNSGNISAGRGFTAPSMTGLPNLALRLIRILLN